VKRDTPEGEKPAPRARKPRASAKSEAPAKAEGDSPADAAE
jgi:hypothetical protein